MPFPCYGCLGLRSAVVGKWHGHSLVLFGLPPSPPSLGGWVGGFGRLARGPICRSAPPSPGVLKQWSGLFAEPPPLPLENQGSRNLRTRNHLPNSPKFDLGLCPNQD